MVWDIIALQTDENRYIPTQISEEVRMGRRKWIRALGSVVLIVGLLFVTKISIDSQYTESAVTEYVMSLSPDTTISDLENKGFIDVTEPFSEKRAEIETFLEKAKENQRSQLKLCYLIEKQEGEHGYGPGIYAEMLHASAFTRQDGTTEFVITCFPYNVKEQTAENYGFIYSVNEKRIIKDGLVSLVLSRVKAFDLNSEWAPLDKTLYRYKAE